MDNSPLQGAGETIVKSGDIIGFEIYGTEIIVFSVKLWTELADEVHVRLLNSKDAHSVVHVSYLGNIYDKQTLH